jgi:perosamine synthetase
MLPNIFSSKESIEESPFFDRQGDISEGLLFRRRVVSNSIQPYKFAYARTAVKYGLISLGIKSGDTLLIPEFICESVLTPLEELGIKPLYYSVNSMLEPDFDLLEKNITNSTKGLLIVHYFGQPQPVAKCIEFCRKHSIFLIEDNAHGFGGTLNGQMLGTFGAIGVCSLRKNFPVINGAYLYIPNNGNLDLPVLQQQPYGSSTIKHYLKYILQFIPPVHELLKYRKHIQEYRRRLGPPPPYDSQESFRNPPLQNDYGMDESAEEFMQRQDIDRIRNKRQQIYHIWQQWAEKQELTPVFPKLSPGAMPLAFPAFTNSGTSSRSWFERGHRAGVDIYSWPTLPTAIVKQNGEAMRIWERMLCFPIHQGMDIQLLEKRLEVL